jgi:hypothetical protein
MPNEDVPVMAFTWNFSSIPFIAPPPFGKLIWGICTLKEFLSGVEIGLPAPIPLSLFVAKDLSVLLWFMQQGFNNATIPGSLLPDIIAS